MPFLLNIWAISTSAVGLHLYRISKLIHMRLRPSKNVPGIVCNSLSLSLSLSLSPSSSFSSSPLFIYLFIYRLFFLLLFFSIFYFCCALKDEWYPTVQLDKRAMRKTDLILHIKYEWTGKCISGRKNLRKFLHRRSQRVTRILFP